MRVSKFPKLRLSQLWGPITLCADLQLRWGLKQSNSPCQNIFDNMLHATYMQGNRGDSQLLVLGNQIGNLTTNPSFSHNLCFKCPNGSCEPILNIYVPRAFQWYNELFNPMGFNLYNCSLKIWESIKTPTPKMGAHLECGGSFPHTFQTMRCNYWASLLAPPSQAFTLVMSPRQLWQNFYFSIKPFFSYLNLSLHKTFTFWQKTIVA